MVPGQRSRGRPPEAPGKLPGDIAAGQTSELLRLQSENELLKGKMKLLEDQVADRSWFVCVTRGNSCNYAVTTKPRHIRQLASECSQIMAGVYYAVTLAT